MRSLPRPANNAFPCNLSNLLQAFSTVGSLTRHTICCTHFAVSGGPRVGNGFLNHHLDHFEVSLLCKWDENMGSFLMLLQYSISTDRADGYFTLNDKNKHTKWPPSLHVLKNLSSLLCFFFENLQLLAIFSKMLLCWLHWGQFKLLEKVCILLVVFDKANISITLAWEL